MTPKIVLKKNEFNEWYAITHYKNEELKTRASNVLLDVRRIAYANMGISLDSKGYPEKVVTEYYEGVI